MLFRSLGLSISRLAMPVIVIAAGWAADRFNAKRTVSACFLLHAVALCLMSVDASVSRIPALCGVFLQAASMAFVFPPLFKVFAQCFSADVPGQTARGIRQHGILDFLYGP